MRATPPLARSHCPLSLPTTSLLAAPDMLDRLNTNPFVHPRPYAQPGLRVRMHRLLVLPGDPAHDRLPLLTPALQLYSRRAHPDPRRRRGTTTQPFELPQCRKNHLLFDTRQWLARKVARHRDRISAAADA